MKKRSGLILVLIGCMLAVTAGENAISITWDTLADVKFRERLNIKLKEYVKIPDFGPSVTALEGKRVQIRGYMIPVSIPDHKYVISAQPMTSCFFCGGAGPQSVIELDFRETPRRFKTDEIRTIAGVLELNPDDPERLCYRLSSAEMVK